MAWDSDIGDEPAGALRDAPPDLRTPIDPLAPVGGHHPAEAGARSIHDTPEHDWALAAERVMPVLRSSSAGGTRLSELGAEQLASEGLRNHALPLLDDGPAGLSIAYAIKADGFDVLVNADHVLEWRIDPDALRQAAFRNLAEWSSVVAWTDERDGGRRILSSDAGEGGDAARILLPEVRRHLEAELRPFGRILVGLPERHLLLATAIPPDDEEFPALFAAFVASHAASADEPIEGRAFELVDGELHPMPSPTEG